MSLRRIVPASAAEGCVTLAVVTVSPLCLSLSQLDADLAFCQFEKFRKFLDTIERDVPDGMDVDFILDTYGTHKTRLIRRWLAKRPRFHLHFTPTSASWLHLVERWFALLT